MYLHCGNTIVATGRTQVRSGTVICCIHLLSCLKVASVFFLHWKVWWDLLIETMWKYTHVRGLRVISTWWEREHKIRLICLLYCDSPLLTIHQLCVFIYLYIYICNFDSSFFKIQCDVAKRYLMKIKPFPEQVPHKHSSFPLYSSCLYHMY